MNNSKCRLTVIFLPFFLGLSLAAPYTYEGMDNQEAEDDEYKGFSEAYEGKIIA